MHDSSDPIDENVQRLWDMLADPKWRNDTRLCGTMLLMSGQIKSRPEVGAVEPELEANGYAAVPSCRKDGRWELWTHEVLTITPEIGPPCSLHFTSGPSETFPTREAALEAGRAWREAQLQQP